MARNRDPTLSQAACNLSFAPHGWSYKQLDQCSQPEGQCRSSPPSPPESEPPAAAALAAHLLHISYTSGNAEIAL